MTETPTNTPGVGARYVIEPMRASDLAEVVAIEQAVYSNPWSREAFLHEIEKNAFSHPIVARATATHPAEIAGYLVAWVVYEDMHIQNIAVHPSHQRRGVGRFILLHALELGKGLGAEVAELEVRASNLPAQQLYVSMGFRETGVRKHYYSNPREDAVLYRKDLFH